MKLKSESGKKILKMEEIVIEDKLDELGKQVCARKEKEGTGGKGKEVNKEKAKEGKTESWSFGRLEK